MIDKARQDPSIYLRLTIRLLYLTIVDLRRLSFVVPRSQVTTQALVYQFATFTKNLRALRGLQIASPSQGSGVALLLV